MIYRSLNRNRQLLFSRIRFSFVNRNLTQGCLEINDRELTSEMKIKIETHWRDKLGDNKFNLSKDKENFYVLSMFPYPSGNLHMGHVRVYSISDSMARFHRMHGKNVLHPIGWDSFGLPAENAAIQRNIPADIWTNDNIKHMKRQLESLGCSFDWSREISTCDPSYYQWTQDLFIKLFDNNLAYQSEAMVNWDPVDKTVLAEEQVDANGRSWRSGAKVEKKLLKQWFVKTTKFAKPLYDGLGTLNAEDWKDIIKIQKHWIGECNGFTFDLKLSGQNPKIDKITLWTGSPEFLLGDCFVGIRNSHFLNNTSNSEYLSNLKLLNPFSGKEMPIVFTDNLEYPMGRSGSLNDFYLGNPQFKESDKSFAEKYQLNLNSSKQNYSLSERSIVLDKAQSLDIGGYPVSSKLQDWLISRQRKWGTPIPIIHCPSCGPVPDRKLPVTLDQIKNPETNCPKCNQLAKRETDTMDTFVDSSWYFLRYIDSNNKEKMFDPDVAHKMMPVDLYIGGKEHAELHLYYARFINHFLHSLKLVPEPEPFKRLLTQGMVMGRSFRVKETGRYIQESEVEIVDLKRNKGVEKSTGNQVVIQWEKMSKSKQNGVDPGDIINEYGCDTTRLFILGNVAPMSHRNWSSDTFPGILNWQKRIWMTIQDFVSLRKEAGQNKIHEEFEKMENILWDSRNHYVSGATFHFKYTQHISSAISNMQGLTNFIRKSPQDVIRHGKEFELSLAAQIIMMAPLAPHFASECWSRIASAENRLNKSNSFVNWELDVLEQRWPEVDLNYNLDLTIYSNGDEVKVVKIPRHQLDSMTVEAAMDITMKDGDVLKMVNFDELKNKTYRLYPGCQADLFLSVKRPQKRKKETVNI